MNTQSQESEAMSNNTIENLDGNCPTPPETDTDATELIPSNPFEGQFSVSVGYGGRSVPGGNGYATAPMESEENQFKVEVYRFVSENLASSYTNVFSAMSDEPFYFEG